MKKWLKKSFRLAKHWITENCCELRQSIALKREQVLLDYLYFDSAKSFALDHGVTLSEHGNTPSDDALIVELNIDGKDYPIHMKKELTSQMVSLKKQNLKASEYAKKSIDEIFPKEVFEKSIMQKTTIGESIIAVNEGDGSFSIKVLPKWVQLSCVCGITCTDLNKDGNLDLVLGGNNFEFKPQYSRIDAN